MLEQSVKAALASLSGRPCDLAESVRRMQKAAGQAAEAGAQLLVFPRECLGGVTAGSLLLDSLEESVYDAARQAAAASGECMMLFSFRMKAGGETALALAAARKGRLWSLAFPHLAPAQLPPFLMKVKTTFGDDVALAGSSNVPIPGLNRMVGVITQRDAGWARSLMDIGAEMIVVLAADPCDAGEDPAAELLHLSHELNCACFYVNAGSAESTQQAVYGGELACAHSGRLLKNLPAFHGETLLVVDAPFSLQGEAPAQAAAAEPRLPFAPPQGPAREAWCRKALEIAAQGLAARVVRVGCRSLQLGLSGGLDSAMALLVSRRALQIAGLQPDALMAYYLPGFGSSARTRENAMRLMRALDLPQREIDIRPVVSAHLQAIGHGGQHDAAYENAQARERTQVLMDLSNMHGGIMVGPGDMSELALGFTTFGGDHLSMYGVNGGLYKSAIRLILRQIAGDPGEPLLSEALLQVLGTPISPELLPGGQATQQTEKILGSYELNDCILFHLLEGRPLRRILALLGEAFPELDARERKEALEGFMRRFVAAQFKRSCMPDGPRVLGQSLTAPAAALLPSDAAGTAWLDALQKDE